MQQKQSLSSAVAIQRTTKPQYDVFVSPNQIYIKLCTFGQPYKLLVVILCLRLPVNHDEHKLSKHHVEKRPWNNIFLNNLSKICVRARLKTEHNTVYIDHRYS